jgi:hypothetical protein
MSQFDANMKSDIAHLSEVKRRLVQKYLSGDLGRNAPGQALLRHRPGTDSAVTEKGQPFPRLRELSLGDYSEVAALESRNGLGLKSYEQWSHIWVNNPAYQELQDGWTIGWVLENEKKQIVGAHGNIPLFYEFRGRRIIAAQGRGWAVDPGYRSYSLWLLMSFFEQKNVELCFDTTAGIEAARANSELGALPVPAGVWNRDVFWITNYPGALSFWLRRRMPKRMSALIPPLSYPLAAALFLKERLTKPALPALQQEFTVEYCQRFDDRFDKFWEDLRKENPDLLLAVRNRKTLEWHFTYALLQHRLCILTVSRDSRLAAYSIFMKTEDPDSGLTQMSLVDFHALRRDAALLLPMVSAALERCRKERIHLLENPGLSFDESGINQLAPYRRDLPWWRYFYKARDKTLADALSKPNAWSPSLYDGDASIL